MRIRRDLQALSKANPVNIGALHGASIQSSLEALGEVVPQLAIADFADAGGGVSGAKARLIRRPLVASLVGVLVIGAAAAGAGVLGTQTHQYNSGKYLHVGGPGEFLRTGAPNFCQFALSLSKSDVYPPGYSSWRPWVIAFENEISPVSASTPCPSGRYPQNQEVTTGAEKGWFAMSNFCAWVNYWEVSKRAGHDRAATRAAAVIRGATKWRAVVAEDPHPHFSKYGGTTFSFLLPYQKAVAAGRVRRVSASFETPSRACTKFVPPANSLGGTVNPLVASHQ